MRIGNGYDIHALVPERPLLLGGVTIPSHFGEKAHSDGDVLIHAIIDALLGAAGAGDIGRLFPDNDSTWKDADSRELLKIAVKHVRTAGYTLVNIDTIVILERPKLSPHIDQIRTSLAEILQTSCENISVKAKTAEGFGAVGTNEAIEAYAVVLLSETETPDMWV